MATKKKESTIKIAGVKNAKQYGFVLLLLFLIDLTGCKTVANQSQKDSPVIGIAWRGQLDGISYKYLIQSLDALNINYVLMDQVITDRLCDKEGTLKSEYLDANGYLTEEAALIVKNTKTEETNLEIVTSGISGIIFSGGSDISPTLYAQPQDWHGIETEKDYDAVRDVSDYLLMKYCLENDVPVMGICRGFQVLAVVSGATIIQDIPTYFQSHGIEDKHYHRMEKDFAIHDVLITDRDSIIGKIIGEEKLENVPSWHHQAVMSVDNTSLKITGVCETCGKQIIEAIERTDKSYVVGYQFHMEVATNENLKYMNKLQAEKLILDFAEYCKTKIER